MPNKLMRQGGATKSLNFESIKATTIAEYKEAISAEIEARIFHFLRIAADNKNLSAGVRDIITQGLPPSTATPAVLAEKEKALQTDIDNKKCSRVCATYCDSFLKSAMASVSLSELCRMDIDCFARMFFALRMTMVLEAIPQFTSALGDLIGSHMTVLTSKMADSVIKFFTKSAASAEQLAKRAAEVKKTEFAKAKQDYLIEYLGRTQGLDACLNSCGKIAFLRLRRRCAVQNMSK
jgi:hypothetical protein